MKLVDRFAHFAQSLMKLLLLLTLYRDLHQRHDAERENGQHRDSDYQFD
jgi:hypothetical protein